MKTQALPQNLPMPQSASPLDQLADIHLPDPVSLWPLAPGWYLLLVLLLIFIWVSYVVYQRQQRQRYRREAIRALQQALADYRQHGSLASYLQVLNLTLRRTALSAGASQAVLSLTGLPWLQWLDQGAQLPGRFSDHTNLLLVAPYQKSPEVAGLEDIHRLALAWVKGHNLKRAGKLIKPARETTHV